MQKVEIFTDGSCLNNPGPGGYGIIIRYEKHEKKISAGYKLTTNNRMELMAVIISLESLIDFNEVILSTDSQYVRLGITKWIYNWKKYNWKTVKKKICKKYRFMETFIFSNSISFHTMDLGKIPFQSFRK